MFNIFLTDVTIDSQIDFVKLIVENLILFDRVIDLKQIAQIIAHILCDINKINPIVRFFIIHEPTKVIMYAGDAFVVQYNSAVARSAVISLFLYNVQTVLVPTG